jgi:hypothetical protein
MTPEEYHSHPAWSSSKKKAAATKTMLSYWAEHEDPMRMPRVPNESMLRGSMVDAFLTQHDQFHEQYFMLPADAPKKPTKTQLNAKKPSPETLIQIEYWERVGAMVGDRKIISEDDVSRCENICDRLFDDPDIGVIMRQRRLCSQEPFFWTADGGYDARYLPDLEVEGGGLLDLKLTRSANPRLLRAQAYSLGYDIQVDHYRQGYIAKYGKPPAYIGLIAYEFDWPHNCCLFIADDELLEHGHERGEKAVADVLACRESGQWPSYGRAAWTLPGYADFANPDNDNNADDLGLEGI